MITEETNSNDLRQQLMAGAAEMKIMMSDHQVQLLLTYLSEFNKWNKAYNLSAVRDVREMIHRHLLDSLSVVPWINSKAMENIIDVGTGGGLPGIPLAILFPNKGWTLLDSNGKKTRFLFHIKTLLGLANVTVENRRVEAFFPEQKFQAVISRAFASLSDMTQGCAHLLAQDGLFMAMKGQYPEEEIKVIADRYRVLETIKLQVAATQGERHLLILQAYTRDV